MFVSVFFFFKQKTAYEMRISDWSSDVCSSDLKEFGMYAVSKAMPLDATAEESKQQILDLVRDFTLETTPGSAAKIPDYRQPLRPGCRVAVPFLPGSDFADTVATATRLQDEGFPPMPPFAARQRAGSGNR